MFNEKLTPTKNKIFWMPLGSLFCNLKNVDMFFKCFFNFYLLSFKKKKLPKNIHTKFQEVPAEIILTCHVFLLCQSNKFFKGSPWFPHVKTNFYRISRKTTTENLLLFLMLFSLIIMLAIFFKKSKKQLCCIIQWVLLLSLVCSFTYLLVFFLENQYHDFSDCRISMYMATCWSHCATSHLQNVLFAWWSVGKNWRKV